MANVVVTRVLDDGPKNYVVHIIIEADGSGDEIRFPVIDPTGVTPVCDHFSIQRIDGTLAGEFGIRLSFGGTTEVPFIDIQKPSIPTSSTEVDHDYHRTGGIPDPKVANYNGTITLTTDGMDAAGDSAMIHLEMTKHGSVR